MTSTPAPDSPLPDNTQQVIGFLRRLASMLSGGSNAEVLLEAAAMIETLSRRAAAAERLFAEQEDDHARNLELREAAEAASDNLMSEMQSLKAQRDAEVASMQEQLDEHRRLAEADRALLAEESGRHQARVGEAEARLTEAQAELDELRQATAQDRSGDLLAEIETLKSQHDTEIGTLKAQRDAEIAAMQAQLDEGRRAAEAERATLVEETQRLQARADVAEARIAEMEAELEASRQPETAAVEPLIDEPPVLDESIAVVPVASLHLARTQFGYLAEGFASKGDLVSQTICEIGARAIDRALAGNEAG